MNGMIRWCTAISLLLGAGFAWAASIGQTVEDATITARIETAIVLNDRLSPLDIKVRTEDGVVTLSGGVGDEIDRNLAQTIAETVLGVRRVVNELVVVENAPSATSKRSWQQTVSDQTVAASVRSRLVYHKEFRGFNLTVRVREGVVTLLGVVGSEEQKNRIADIALDTRGVDRVVNNLVVNPVEERDLNRNLGTMLSDQWVEKRIESSILVSRHISIHDLKVDVQDGVCILTGQVESEQQKALADNIAANTSGVREVRNQIKVVKPDLSVAEAPKESKEPVTPVMAPAAPEPAPAEAAPVESAPSPEVVTKTLPTAAPPVSSGSSAVSGDEEVELEPLVP